MDCVSDIRGAEDVLVDFSPDSALDEPWLVLLLCCFSEGAVTVLLTLELLLRMRMVQSACS